MLLSAVSGIITNRKCLNHSKCGRPHKVTERGRHVLKGRARKSPHHSAEIPNVFVINISTKTARGFMGRAFMTGGAMQA